MNFHAVIKRVTRRQVDEILADDHLFSLDVNISSHIHIYIYTHTYTFMFTCVYTFFCCLDFFDFFFWVIVKVKLCNGKIVHVEACRKGFYSVGKQRILCHNLVDLLRQLSRAFDNVCVFLFIF